MPSDENPWDILLNEMGFSTEKDDSESKFSTEQTEKSEEFSTEKQSKPVKQQKKGNSVLKGKKAVKKSGNSVLKKSQKAVSNPIEIHTIIKELWGLKAVPEVASVLCLLGSITRKQLITCDLKNFRIQRNTALKGIQILIETMQKGGIL